MTIRSYIRRRVFIAYALVLLGVCAIAASQVLIGNEDQPPTWFFFAFVPFIGAWLYMFLGIRCPRCKGNLTRSPAIYPTFSKKHRFNYCPYCGVAIDENV